MEAEFEGEQVFFVSCEDLITSKRARGRRRDLAEARLLEERSRRS